MDCGRSNFPPARAGWALFYFEEEKDECAAAFKGTIRKFSKVLAVHLR
jgi:hypothetical protein